MTSDELNSAVTEALTARQNELYGSLAELKEQIHDRIVKAIGSGSSVVFFRPRDAELTKEQQVALREWLTLADLTVTTRVAREHRDGRIFYAQDDEWVISW